jgi:hypothetical protein
MNSRLDARVLYDDVSDEVTEHDVDVMSDLWNMDGRDVYRGSRDPRYTHANVYWLYDEDLRRVGLTEHSLADHADFRILWFYESGFATFMQEEGWTTGPNVWSILPSHVYERCFSEGWTTPATLLEQCLDSPYRIVTPEMLASLPKVYSCVSCKRASLSPICVSNQMAPLDFPDKAKIVFVDDDLVIHNPPSDSTIFTLLGFGTSLTQPQPHDDGSSKPVPTPEPPQVQEQAPPPQAPSEPEPTTPAPHP